MTAIVVHVLCTNSQFSDVTMHQQLEVNNDKHYIN